LISVIIFSRHQKMHLFSLQI